MYTRRRSRIGNVNPDVVSVQADPYSAKFFTTMNTAENVLNDRIGTKSGGKRSGRRSLRILRHRRTQRSRRFGKN
jgi:hypothetical protein